MPHQTPHSNPPEGLEIVNRIVKKDFVQWAVCILATSNFSRHDAVGTLGKRNKVMAVGKGQWTYRSNIRGLPGAIFFGNLQIGQFGATIAHEDVTCAHIAMHISFLGHIFESCILQ